jgi:hypothetical protein
MGASFFLAAVISLSAALAGQSSPAAPADAPNRPAAPALAAPPPDADVEKFLREAKILGTKGTKKGVTGSLRATMSDGTLTHDAQIQTIEESKREFRTNTGIEFDFRDSWTFNIAAYKIDRLIGLNMVPVSVTRTHRSTPAAFTWWVDDYLMDEQDRTKNKVEAPDRGYYSRQRAMMHVFDELIGNVDRNMGNILYLKDWRLVLIDHTRAFRKYSTLKVPAQVTRCDRQVYEAMKKLDRETLKRDVGKQLDDGQIKSLLARRDAIVKKLDSLAPSSLFDRVAPAITTATAGASSR